MTLRLHYIYFIDDVDDTVPSQYVTFNDISAVNSHSWKYMEQLWLF